MKPLKPKVLQEPKVRALFDYDLLGEGAGCLILNRVQGSSILFDYIYTLLSFHDIISIVSNISQGPILLKDVTSLDQLWRKGWLDEVWHGGGKEPLPEESEDEWWGTWILVTSSHSFVLLLLPLFTLRNSFQKLTWQFMFELMDYHSKSAASFAELCGSPNRKCLWKVGSQSWPYFDATTIDQPIKSFLNRSRLLFEHGPPRALRWPGARHRRSCEFDLCRIAHQVGPAAFQYFSQTKKPKTCFGRHRTKTKNQPHQNLEVVINSSIQENIPLGTAGGASSSSGSECLHAEAFGDATLWWQPWWRKTQWGKYGIFFLKLLFWMNLSPPQNTSTYLNSSLKLAWSLISLMFDIPFNEPRTKQSSLRLHRFWGTPHWRLRLAEVPLTLNRWSSHVVLTSYVSFGWFGWVFHWWIISLGFWIFSWALLFHVFRWVMCECFKMLN